LSENETLERPDDPKDTARLKAVLVMVATIAFVVTPFIADPFTGFDPALFPVPVDDPPIQPAGWAFAIWGVIYLWLLVSAGYGLFKRDVDPDWDRLRWPLFVSVGIGASWISVALIAPVLATVLIWLMLIGAVIALRLAPTRDFPWLALPLGLYAGWLTAASSVALATVLAGYGWGSVTVMSWIGVGLALVIAITVDAERPRAHLPPGRGLGARGDRRGQRHRPARLLRGRTRRCARHALAGGERRSAQRPEPTRSPSSFAAPSPPGGTLHEKGPRDCRPAAQKLEENHAYSHHQ
jgi:hypothetical protein